MSQKQHDAERLDKLRKTARSISLMLFWPGVAGVLLSFFESSPIWIFFVVLTAWLGVVQGLTGAPGLADHLLQRIPPDRRVSSVRFQVTALLTFWIPTLATAVFGLALASVLPEHLRPKTQINDGFILLIPQAFAMYFISAGVCWFIVGREVKLAQQDLEMNEGMPATETEFDR